MHVRDLYMSHLDRVIFEEARNIVEDGDDSDAQHAPLRLLARIHLTMLLSRTLFIFITRLIYISSKEDKRK